MAFSGGVDSSVLAKAAHRALRDQAVAVTFDTPTYSRRELKEAREVAADIGIRHIIVEYSELSDADFTRNPGDRCFFCKRMMAKKLKDVAEAEGLANIVEGTTVDELAGHRPGYRAIKESGILSPFVELGLTKNDVVALAKEYGLEHDKPPGACLSSRIPEGTKITEPLLRTVEEAEDYLRTLGLRQVRVRIEGEDARIEVYAEDFAKVIEHSQEIKGKLPFRRVSLDLSGYSYIDS